MDRRNFERFDIEVPARVDVISEGKSRRRFFCESFNVSAGGIFLNTAEPIPENSDVEIEIVLFFEDPKDMTGAGQQIHITAMGKIVRCERSGLVVRFNEGFEVAIADPESGKMVRVSPNSDALDHAIGAENPTR